jgi:hypothetical protein
MSAENFVNYLMKKYYQSKIKGDKKVELGSLKEGSHFLFPDLYGGIIGQLVKSGINATIIWKNHPEKRSNRREVIATSAKVFPYDYS